MDKPMTFTRMIGPQKQAERCLLSSLDFDRVVYLTHTEANGDIYIGWDNNHKFEFYLLFN